MWECHFQFSHVGATRQEVQTQRTDGLRNSDTCQGRAICESTVTDSGNGEFIVIVILVLGVETTRNDETAGIGAIFFSVGDGGGVVCFVKDVPDTIHLRGVQ